MDVDSIFGTIYFFRVNKFVVLALIKGLYKGLEKTSVHHMHGAYWIGWFWLV